MIISYKVKLLNELEILPKTKIAEKSKFKKLYKDLFSHYNSKYNTSNY